MLSENLKVLLGSTFVLYVKAHGFHFNVEGPNFPQYHAFLGEYYSNVYGTIDKIGEYIRSLDSYAPGSLTRYVELSQIYEQIKIPRAELMFHELYDDNSKMIALLKETFDAAVGQNEQGIANFLAERLDQHGKLGWQIRSILKIERA